jgi:DNA-directed RNA polymerase specialized sigma24 family protein
VEEDVILTAWQKAMWGVPKFRGTSAGEAVRWLDKIARNVSRDERRKRQREWRRTRGRSPAPEPFTVPSDQVGLDDEEEGEAFLLELRDERLREYCVERFPKRRAAREQVELAYLAAVDREGYAEALRDADDAERQRIHKKMGRGRDELWLPFLETLEADDTLEDVHRVLIRGLIDALESTRRADHGKSRTVKGGES